MLKHLYSRAAFKQQSDCGGVAKQPSTSCYKLKWSKTIKAWKITKHEKLSNYPILTFKQTSGAAATTSTLPGSGAFLVRKKGTAFAIVKNDEDRQGVSAGGAGEYRHGAHFSPRVGPRGRDDPRPHAGHLSHSQRGEDVLWAGAGVRAGRQPLPGATHHLDETHVSFLDQVDKPAGA